MRALLNAALTYLCGQKVRIWSVLSKEITEKNIVYFFYLGQIREDGPTQKS